MPARGRILPTTFVHTVSATYGDEGRQWLTDLPRLLDEAAERWSLTLHAPYQNLTYNYVTQATRADGTAVVLKLGVPNPELSSEEAALRAFNGHGAVPLLAANPEQGMMLLARLAPGQTLVNLSLEDDEQATRIAAQVMQHLWRPLPAAHAFKSVAQWAAGFGRLRARFGGGSGPLPEKLVADAEAIYAHYLDGEQTAVLLHGDLHHDNILAGPEGWLAIDPKGIVGEPAYETGALMRNPIPAIYHAEGLRLLLDRRATILSELLGFERERILNWSFAQAILSAWWSLEDNTPNWSAILPLARQLRALQP